MANKVPTSGALVPIIGPSGDIQWQSWTYGELVQHLNHDLSVDPNTLDSSVLRSTLKSGPYTAPTLINAWTNVGGVFDTAGFLLDATGFVHLQGYVQGGATGTVAFVLPAGYRPGAIGNWAAWESAGNGQWGGVRVDTAGNVSIFMSAALQVSLDTVTFLAVL